MIRISRPLRLDSPLYPGTPPPEVVPFRSLEQGDASSSSLITIHSHSGTHIDNDDVAELYTILPVGTPVTIHE